MSGHSDTQHSLSPPQALNLWTPVALRVGRALDRRLTPSVNLGTLYVSGGFPSLHMHGLSIQYNISL